jgi:hypothetical protein
MIDVVNKKCQYKDCLIQPNYNFMGESNGIYCSEHKLENMIDVINQKCQFNNCFVRPIYNYDDMKNGIYCAEHKLENMIDVVNKKCQYKDCLIQPNYNFIGESNGIYCSEHKLENMINVINQKCVYKDCLFEPIYNFKGELKALYCNEHKLENMIDVKHKKCLFENCNTRPSFGYIGQYKTHCAKHKLPLMFKNTKVVCDEENCKEISEFGINNAIHCFLHKKDNEYCLLGKKCVQCNRENELCDNSGFCITYCRPSKFFQESKKYEKKKEELVLSYLNKNIKSDIFPIDDKIIDSTCVKRRPDRIYDCLYYFLIIEIDEFQHKNYYNGCIFDRDTQEKRRMIQIHEALNIGTIPCIFLRFNPDSFIINGKKDKINMQKRLETLTKWVNYCLNINFKKVFGKKDIVIKYLFYDDYDETNIEFESYDEETLKKCIG